MFGLEKIIAKTSLFFIIVHVERMQEDEDQQVNYVGCVFYWINTFFYSLRNFLRWFFASFFVRKAF